MPRALFHFGVVQILASGVDKGGKAGERNGYMECKRKSLKSLSPLASTVFGSLVKRMGSVTHALPAWKGDYYRIQNF